MLSTNHELWSCILPRDGRGKLPYSLAASKEVRDVFRRFMAKYPDRYDYKLTQVSNYRLCQSSQCQKSGVLAIFLEISHCIMLEGNMAHNPIPNKNNSTAAFKKPSNYSLIFPALWGGKMVIFPALRGVKWWH